MKLLIGFVGRKRSGKDTLANLVQKTCSNVNILSFADPLKQACKHAYHLRDDQLDLLKDEVDDRWGLTPRDMMRSLGTGSFRSADPEHWIKVMGMRMAGLDKVVVPDVRFQNEALFIRRNGGVLVHVSRKGLENDDDHVTEKTTDSIVCGYSIYNDGTLEELEVKFNGLVRVVLDNIG